MKVAVYKNRYSLNEIVLAVLICLMPILDPYIFFDAGGQEIHVVDVLCLFAVIYVIARFRRIEVNKDLMTFLAILFFVSIISFWITDVSGRSMPVSLRVWSIWVLYSGLFGIVVKHVSQEATEYMLIIFGWIVSLFLLFQIVCLSLRIPVWDGQLPILTLSEDNGWHGFYETTGVIRAHSFFQEPSYYAIYMLPVLAVSLKRNRIWESIYFAATIMLTTSSIGLMGVIINIVVYFINNAKRKVNKNKFLKIAGVFSVGCVVLIGMYFANSQVREIIDFMLNKIGKMGADLQNERMGSTKLRLIGNATIFVHFDFLNQIFGLGIHQYLRVWSNLIPYSNTFVTLLLNSGILGVFTFSVYIIKWMVKSKGFNKVFPLIFLMIMLADHVLFNWYFFYLLYWVYASFDKTYKKDYLSLTFRKYN